MQADPTPAYTPHQITVELTEGGWPHVEITCPHGDTHGQPDTPCGVDYKDRRVCVLHDWDWADWKLPKGLILGPIAVGIRFENCDEDGGDVVVEASDG